MKLSRRTMAALSGAALLSPAVARTAVAQDNPTITYWMESASGSDKIQWVIDNIIKEYNDRGGVQVEAIVQPEIWTATSTALSGGAGPDVVFTPGPTFAMELAKSDRLASLDSYAEEFGWADRFFPLGAWFGYGGRYPLLHPVRGGDHGAVLQRRSL